MRPVPNASLELERRRAFTRRVQVGAYYSDGERLAEVVKTYGLGYVILRDVRLAEGCWSEVDPYIGCGIDAFRRDWWLVRGPAETEAA